LTDGGVTLAVIALPEREDSPPGEQNRGANVEWTVAAPDGAEPEPVDYWLALRRVERWLKALGMPRSLRRELVVQNCMARALGRWRQEPDTDLSRLALAEIEDALERWFTFVLGEENVGEQSPLLVGQAALDACEAASHWPNALLTYDHLPATFVEAMRAAQATATPAELPGNMLEQQLEFWSPREFLTRLFGRWARGFPGSAAPAA
jgi:hypothetical protein